MSVSLAKTGTVTRVSAENVYTRTEHMIKMVHAAESDEWNAANIACGIVRNDVDALWFYYSATRNGFEHQS